MFQFLRNLFGGKPEEKKPTIQKSSLTAGSKNRRTTGNPIGATTTRSNTSSSQSTRSSKAKKSSEPSKPFVNNAPEHWAQLSADGGLKMFPEGDTRNWLTGALMYSSKILASMKEHHGIEGKSSYKENIDLVEGELAVSSSVQQLCAKGILKVDVAVREKGRKYAVFVFEKEVSQKTIDAINEALRPYGYEEVIWYAPAMPNTLGSVDLPMMQFDRTSITHIKDYKSKHAQYAMWWSSPNDTQFTKSKAAKYITDFYEVVDGYETSMNGLFGVMFKMHLQIDRVDLPQDLVIPFEGPGSEVILLGIGKKRGFNFYFPVNDRMTMYRDDFLREFVPFTKEMIKLMKERKYKQDRWPNMPIEWWKARLDKARIQEATEGEGKLMSLFEPIRQNNPNAN